MIDIMNQSSDMDSRPTFFRGLTPERLAEHTESWPRPIDAPPQVQDLLAQSRRLFVGAATCYDNFAQSVLVSLQAAEVGLKWYLGYELSEQKTLGKLIYSDDTSVRLSAYHYDWYRELVLRFRNDLAHPDQARALTPGIAASIVLSVHDEMNNLFRS